MEQTIWKYKLTNSSRQTLFLPKGAKILTVQVQNIEVVLWVLVNPDNETEERIIIMFGTGNPIDTIFNEKIAYIGTFQINNGNLVYHVFEYTGF